MVEYKKVLFLGRMSLMNRKCDYCGQDTGQEDIYCANCGSLLREQKKEVEIEESQEALLQLGTNSPLTLGDYMFIGLILLVPIVNIIVLFVWALDKHGNLNRRNLAKAGLIYFGIGIGLSVILGIGLVRAVYLDQQRYPIEEYHEYEMQNPDFGDWGDLPFDTEET